MRGCKEVVIVDAVRTPIGKNNGTLKSVRPDHLGAVESKKNLEGQPSIDYSTVEEVVMGNANQAWQDNCNEMQIAG